MAKEKVGDICSTEYQVMLGEKWLGSFTVEAEAIAYAERTGGTVKTIEWKFAGSSQ